MRLIDADALIDDCKKYLNTLNPSRDGKECTRIHWLIGILSNAPTIEPERKTGKWITQEFGSWAECSECHELYDIPIAYSNFCPNCGTDMRGNKDG